MRITVVGMGKIGLPLAVQFAKKGHSVIGVDIDPKIIELINSGVEPFPGEAHLGVYLKKLVSQNLFSTTTETSVAVSTSDVVVVVVPLYVDQSSQPDFQAIDAATIEISRGLKPGTLVSFETTLPVGTTRNRLTPILEKESGLKAGEDFYVVFSPERVLTGRVFEDLRKYPKLVGGINDASEKIGIDFYSKVLDFDERPELPKPNGVWSLGSAEASELAKLAETTYRDVNIGLANQFALFSENNGIDFYSVREACNSQPFSNIHLPGISVGGHCIPVYPRLYLWNDPDATIVSAARQANASMPKKIVLRIENEMGSIAGLKVVILGASYRGGVKETAFSGVFELCANLKNLGSIVTVHDPLYSDKELLSLELVPFHKGESADIAIIHTDHQEYKEWSDKDIPNLKLLMDGRNLVSSKSWRGTFTVMKIGQANQKI
jgi:nucleotide sugar dehydrogenase